MKALFLDTSGWLAAHIPTEAGHAAASARFATLVAGGHTPLTTSLVVAEMHPFVVRRSGIRSGQRFLESALGGAIHVVYPDAELIRAAFAGWIARYGDQRFSLCDAVSFEVMRRERITKALAFDRHFAAAGFDIAS